MCRLSVNMAKASAPHPFAPLSGDEIKNSANLLRAQWPFSTDIQFKAITLEEPSKHEVVPLLEKERRGEAFAALDRRAFVSYQIRKTNKFHEAIVNLSEQKVESNARLGNNVHAPGDGAEISEIERIAIEDQGVQAEIAKLQLPQGTVVVCDPWIYGACIPPLARCLAADRA